MGAHGGLLLDARLPGGPLSLRYLTVNFWGFDGHRSRGAIVVNASIASRTVAVTRLYEQRFRIRQMKVMDSSWGHAPIGPGADDYAAMDADNTSGFNCRYVGGEESKKGWSNHAYGTAIDVNDFENPYIAGPGRVYPDAWFATRRDRPAGVGRRVPVRLDTFLPAVDRRKDNPRALGLSDRHQPDTERHPHHEAAHGQRHGDPSPHHGHAQTDRSQTDRSQTGAPQACATRLLRPHGRDLSAGRPGRCPGFSRDHPRLRALRLAIRARSGAVCRSRRP